MKIFTPFPIQDVTVHNRLIRSATCEYMADETGCPDDRFLSLYQTLAKGEIGIVVTGFCYVMENGKSTPGQCGIHDDALIPAWKEVTSLFRNTSSILLMQIVHGGRQVRPKGHVGPIWAPSAVPDPAYKTTPVEMGTADIQTVVQAFSDAARRAEAAGFQGIQLHMGHGYLLSQFLSPYTNRRSDAYGGDQSKRTRLAADIVRAIKETVSPGFLVTAKINAEDCLGGGLILNQAVISAMVLEKAGLDMIEVSGGMAESTLGPVRKDILKTEDEGYYRFHGGAIRRSVDIPVATVGGFRSLDLMEQTLESGDADFIGLSRPFVREPDLAVKMRENRSQKSECISCNRCFNPRGLQCAHVS